MLIELYHDSNGGTPEVLIRGRVFHYLKMKIPLGMGRKGHRRTVTGNMRKMG